MKLILILHVLTAVLTTYSNAATWGVERTACNFFTPSHIGRNKRPPDDYYKISSTKMMFSPGETIEIKITGANPRDDYTYEGILMSVQYKNVSCGKWEETFDYRHIDCNNNIGSAIADSGSFPKVVGEDVFRWTAPEDCEYGDMYYVKATVVKNKREYLDGLTLPLKTVHTSENKKDSCSRKFYEIPEGAVTSFEPNNLGNWTSDKTLRNTWTWMTGQTPSPGTGPEKAYDGDYYMYFEGSFPTKKGQKAILISPPGLSGCLCFRFAYHKYTDQEAKFYCIVNGREVQCQHPGLSDEYNDSAPMDKRRDKWINSWLSINEPGSIEIKIVAQCGSTFRSDIAVDNFTFTPGTCKEDEKIHEF